MLLRKLRRYTWLEIHREESSQPILSAALFCFFPTFHHLWQKQLPYIMIDNMDNKRETPIIVSI